MYGNFSGFRERFFPVNRKIPERCSGIMKHYGIYLVPENFGLRNKRSRIFREKVPENVKDILNLCKR